VVPYTSWSPAVPWMPAPGTGRPVDDECTARYSFCWGAPPKHPRYGGENFSPGSRRSPPPSARVRTGSSARVHRRQRLPDRPRGCAKRNSSAEPAPVADFVSQDFMCDESMGPRYDRHPGAARLTGPGHHPDAALLISARRARPPRARSPRRSASEDYWSILRRGEDPGRGAGWRTLPHNEDPPSPRALDLANGPAGPANPPTGGNT